MNATTTTQQKQIGDRVRITGGQAKDQVGTITAKERRGWTIELEDGTQVTVGFPMIVLIDVTEVEETVEPHEESSETISAEAAAEPASDDTVNEAPTEQATPDAAGDEAETESPTESRIEEAADNATAPEVESPDPVELASGEDASTDETASTAISPEIAKMTVRQLWDLAKQRGVSVARTKSDFFRIIKAMNPDEDMTVLKGKALFDRVSELHISRLRSKQEMARLLSA